MIAREGRLHEQRQDRQHNLQFENMNFCCGIFGYFVADFARLFLLSAAFNRRGLHSKIAKNIYLH